SGCRKEKMPCPHRRTSALPSTSLPTLPGIVVYEKCQSQRMAFGKSYRTGRSQHHPSEDSPFGTKPNPHRPLEKHFNGSPDSVEAVLFTHFIRTGFYKSGA